jgi:hypothetical protein
MLILVIALLLLLASAAGLLAWANSRGATGYTGGAIAQAQVANAMDKAMGLDGPPPGGEPPTATDPGIPVTVQVVEPVVPLVTG